MCRTWKFRKGGGKKRPAAEEKLAPFLNAKMAGPRMVHQKLNVIWTRGQCTTLIHRRDIPASAADVEEVVMTEEGVAAEWLMVISLICILNTDIITHGLARVQLLWVIKTHGLMHARFHLLFYHIDMLAHFIKLCCVISFDCK